MSLKPYQHMKLEPITYATQLMNGIYNLQLCSNSVNSISIDMLNELITVFQDINSNRSIKGILLTSHNENVFSSGLNLVDAISHMSTVNNTIQLNELIGYSLTSPLRCQKPVCALITGSCIAGGTILALSCDYVVCSNDTRYASNVVGLTELAVGMSIYIYMCVCVC